MVFRILLLLFITVHLRAQESTDTISLPITEQLADVEIYSTLILEDNAISLSRKQFLTLSGALEDPTRLLIKFPGISTVNDQANSVVYRGMPAQYHRWSLYGARILNPNHLGNAGTISDFPSRSAGGVNMFSGQVIGNLEFNGSPSGSSLDAISANSDIKLRKPYRNALNTNISLIGIEAGLDKMAKDGQSNVLLNYRYSTVGLLTKLGLDFGGEAINYQDITGKYSKSLSNGDAFSTYFSVGYNSNMKAPLALENQPEMNKDLQQIDYQSLNVIAGALYNRAREDYQFRNTLNLSINSTDRTSIIPISSSISNSEYRSEEILISSKHDYRQKGTKWNYGFTFEPYLHIISLEKKYPNKNQDIQNKESLERTALHLIPSIYSNYKLSNHWSIMGRIGLQSVLGEENIIDATGQGVLKYSNSSFTSSFRFSKVSQVFQPEILIYNIESDFVKGNNYEVNASYQGFTLSGFIHQIFNLPISTNSYGFSAFDNLDNLPLSNAQEPIVLRPEGEVEIAGIAFSMVRKIAGINVLGNITLMDSKHYGKEETTKAPLDYGHIFNVMLTKNWELSGGKEFGISTSFHHRGGARQNQVDLNRSFEWGYTNYAFENQYATRLNDYYRMDLRILYKPSKRSTISLDIQNVTNRENDAYYYFESYKPQSRLQKQLGMIPILGWRVDW